MPKYCAEEPTTTNVESAPSETVNIADLSKDNNTAVKETDDDNFFDDFFSDE